MTHFTNFHAELDVLTPLPNAVLTEESEHSWPDFKLQETEIRDKQDNLVNLFSASVDNLLQLSGSLKTTGLLEKVYATKWKRPRPNDPKILVSQVGRYAFGADSSNRIVIWAAGKAGWYTLAPSRAYKDIFADMKEAVQCWYFVLDTCSKESVAPTQVFKQYSSKCNIKPAKAEERIKKHGAFIFANMKENKEHIKWPTKPFYHYLRLKVDISTKVPTPSSSVTKIAETGSPVIKPAPSRSPAKLSPPATTPSTRSSQTPSTLPIHPPKRRGRPPKNPDHFQLPTRLEPLPSTMQQGTRTRSRRQPSPTKQVPKEVDSSDAIKLKGKQTSDAALLWKYILKATESIKITQLTLNNASWEIHTHFEFSSVDEARNYLIYQSESLLQYMTERRRNKEWKNAPIFKELQESDPLPSSVIARLARRKFKPRTTQLDDDLQATPLYYPSSSDESAIPRHQVLSVLRPKGRKGKYYSGKSPALALGKRKQGDDDQRDVRAKRRATAESAEGTSREMSPSSTTSQAQQAVEGASSNGLRWRKSRHAGDAQDPMGLAVTATLDDAHANGDGDVWHCPEFGCSETVYGASEELGRVLIGEHREEHVVNDGQVDVVMREMKRCNVPVSNLIKKLREFSSAQDLAQLVNNGERSGPLVPDAIRRLMQI